MEKLSISETKNVFRVLQILENNKNCLVLILVNPVVLACLEILVKHSHSFMKYYFNTSNVKLPLNNTNDSQKKNNILQSVMRFLHNVNWY